MIRNRTRIIDLLTMREVPRSELPQSLLPTALPPNALAERKRARMKKLSKYMRGINSGRHWQLVHVTYTYRADNGATITQGRGVDR